MINISKNKYYCRINGKVENLEDIQKIIDNNPNKEIAGEIMFTMYEHHNMNDSDAYLFEEVIKFNNYEIPADYNECLEHMRAHNRARVEAMNSGKVKCPYCKSTNVKKIGVSGRLLSTATLGLAGSKIGKQWYCRNCKSDF